MLLTQTLLDPRLWPLRDQDVPERKSGTVVVPVPPAWTSGPVYPPLAPPPPPVGLNSLDEEAGSTWAQLLNLSGHGLQPASRAVPLTLCPHRGSSCPLLRMASPSSPPAFRLETSDRSREDGAERDRGQPGGGVRPPPMESAFQPEDRMFPPQITVDLHYRKRAGAR